MIKSGANEAVVSEAVRLRSLADELSAIASALQQDGSEQSFETEELGNYLRVDAADEASLAVLARNFYRSRRLRSRVFGDTQLFGEPAWDILLDLFVAEAEAKPLSVTSACIGAAVPTSTALRWLVILEEQGLVRRENDPSDARRVFLHLTGEGYARMTDYFLQLQREGVVGD